MKNLKGFLSITGTLAFALMIMNVGLFSFPAQAAGEATAQLETYLLEADDSAAVCIPDAAGMVAYWPLDDGPSASIFADVIENTAFNNGACADLTCPTSTISGKVNSGFVFDGGDEILVTDTTGLNFTIDGDILFFDEKGDIIKAKKMQKRQFEDQMKNYVPQSTQNITVYTFGPGSNCKIIIVTPYGTYCFWVNCETGQYIGPC